MIAVVFFHTLLIKIFDIDEKLENYINARIIIVLAEFVFFIMLIGLLVENYFNYTSRTFRKWKAEKCSR